ncbi:Pectin lyase fold [Phytophthora cactorum]|nr:Pectin lyase fold [Phytophthora cactorum]
MYFFQRQQCNNGTSVGAQANTPCSGANAQSVPPPDAIVVDITGTNNASYQTVAKGMLHLPNTTEEQTIFVFPGVYQEHVVIPRQAGPLVVQGYTCDMTSYTENKVTITHTTPQKDLAPEVNNNCNDLVSTLRLKSSSGVKFYNVNVANPTGKINTLGQAVAVYVDAPNYGFYSCNFTGYQDTLCASKGESSTPGRTSAVLLTSSLSCRLRRGLSLVLSRRPKRAGSPPTAIGTAPTYHGRVFGSGGKRSTYPGRPWHSYARVVWQNSELSDVVNPIGWAVWDKVASTANVLFKKFTNSGPGEATDKRFSFSGQLNAYVHITDHRDEGYESDLWVDTTFL